MDDDIAPRILAAIEAREAAAKSWGEDDLNSLHWRVAGARQLIYQNNVADVVMAIDCQANGALSWEAIYVRHDIDGRRAAFIVANSPASVLRACTIDRRRLDRHSPVTAVEGRYEGELICGGCSVGDDQWHARPFPCPDLLDLADSYGVAPESTAGHPIDLSGVDLSSSIDQAALGRVAEHATHRDAELKVQVYFRPDGQPDGQLFLLRCRECDTDPEAPIPFESAEARGKWAAAHRDGTGHDTWWVHDHTPRERP